MYVVYGIFLPEGKIGLVTFLQFGAYMFENFGTLSFN